MNTPFRKKFSLILIGNILLIGLIATGVQGFSSLPAILRLILGLIYVLFIPGYLLQLALFPQTIDLDTIERIVLSFALSGVIIPPIALILNWLPWGIRLWPIVITLSLFIVVCMGIAIIRKLRIPAEKDNGPKTSLSLRTWWIGQERAYQITYIILLVTLVAASITAYSILVTPKPADNFTEFYMLGQDGLAEDYPREVVAGETISVTTGITNHEGAVSTYNILIKSGEQVIGQAGPITLENKATWEQPVHITNSIVGDDQQVTFILNREGRQSPYRTLLLWITVKSAETP